MNFSNLKISTRLVLGFGSTLLLLFAIAAISVVSITRSNESLRQIVDINGKKMELLEDMTNSVHVVSRVMRTVALLKDEEEKKNQAKKIVSAQETYDSSLSSLDKLPLSEKGKALLARLGSEEGVSRKVNDQFMSLVKTDHDAAVDFLVKSCIPANGQWQDTLSEFDQLQRDMNKVDADEAFASNHTAIVSTLVFSGAALAICIMFGLLITRSILKQLGGEPKEASSVAMQIAEGDLTVQIDVLNTDSSSMMYAIKKMRDNLAGIVSNVRSGTDAIATASSQIASGNLDLSSRTEQQAASLEETASSMEELTSTVKQNADNSRQANLFAESASEVAIKGGTVVSEVVNTMSAINESAKKIVDIIGVIDGIAFQTNILALNAAVEAARAGEQGRGFAVVATEVRNLAQRSAAAAKEIKALITDSVEKVDAGSKLVDQAGGTMKEIVESVKRVGDIINDIASSNHEQSAGIEQINLAITQMDQVTQQNAALVEEAAAAAGAMQEQAENLVETVKVFRIENTSMSTNSERAEFFKKSMHKKSTQNRNAMGAVGMSRPAVPQVSHAKPVQKAVANKVPALQNDDWEEF